MSDAALWPLPPRPPRRQGVRFAFCGNESQVLRLAVEKVEGLGEKRSCRGSPAAAACAFLVASLFQEAEVQGVRVFNHFLEERWAAPGGLESVDGQASREGTCSQKEVCVFTGKTSLDFEEKATPLPRNCGRAKVPPRRSGLQTFAEGARGGFCFSASLVVGRLRRR